MKGKLLLGLFALPFFGVGVWMLWTVSATCWDAWQMRDWPAVAAELSEAGFESHAGDDTTTYEAFATYHYEFAGRAFSGQRVSLGSGGDNIGDYQEETGNRLRRAHSAGETITVYVNPAAPDESIIDREIRWGLLGFKSIFVFVFGGVGLGMLIAAFRSPTRKDPNAEEYQSTPWRLNPDWQGGPIRSNAKLTMWGAWGFTALWNLVSAPLPFVLYEEVSEKQNYLALVGLLFPIIGLGMLFWAARRTAEWRRFGVTPLTLDPFPGSIGGHVGGTIDTRLPFDSAQRFVLTLSSLRSYVSGSGDSRSRRETALWQDQAVAHTESGPTGMRLVFRFDVPAELRESEAQPEGKDYYLWRLNLKADLPGSDINRDFEIPVYATAKTSAAVSDKRAGADDPVRHEVFDEAVRKLARISNDGLGKTIVFPMGQNLLANAGAILIGGSFAAAGWFIVVHEGEKMFGSLFGGTGAIIASAALYMLFKSLEIRQRGDEIVSTRRWLGIPIGRKTLHRSQFQRFRKSSNMQTRSGNEHVRHYKISGIDRQGHSVVLGEGYRGELEARAGVRFLEKELGLQQQELDPEQQEQRSRFELNKEMFVRRSASASRD